MNGLRCRTIGCTYNKDGFCGFEGIVFINEWGFCSAIIKLNDKRKIEKNIRFSPCEVSDVEAKIKNDEK